MIGSLLLLGLEFSLVIFFVGFFLVVSFFFVVLFFKLVIVFFFLDNVFVFLDIIILG